MSANDAVAEPAVRVLVLAAIGQLVAGVALAIGVWQLGLMEFGQRVVFTDEFSAWEILSFLCTCVYLVVIVRYFKISKIKKFCFVVLGILVPVICQPCVAIFYLIRSESEGSHDIVG